MSQNRSEDSKAFKKITFEFGGYKLRYAWVSQRGYYPEDLDKANQDAHVEVENFGKGKGVIDSAFFAVFDGHGKTGDHCAIYARDHIPGAFINEIVKVRREAVGQPVHVGARGDRVRCSCIDTMRTRSLRSGRLTSDRPGRHRQHRAGVHGRLRRGE